MGCRENGFGKMGRNPSNLLPVASEPVQPCLTNGFACRLLAIGHSMVQRVRIVRRAGLLLQHHAHVLHQLGPLSRHTESSEDEARLRHQANRRHQDRCRVGSVAGRFHFGNPLR